MILRLRFPTRAHCQMLVEIDKNARIVKDDMHFIVYLEVWRAIDELGELWNVEYTLEEESYMKYVELRSIDPGYKVLQIFAVPLESQPGKGGEESACPMSTSVPGRPVMILRAREIGRASCRERV